MATNHQRFGQAFKASSGLTLSTAQIKGVLRRMFPAMSQGSMLPNDHAQGNKSACRCAGTKTRIFDRVSRGFYRVR